MAEVTDDTGIHDPIRTAYIGDHLRALLRARERGFDVRGYYAWSLMDNLEWASGWTKKFGLIRVDPATGTRTPKDSARWYRDVLARPRLTTPPCAHTVAMRNISIDVNGESVPGYLATPASGSGPAVLVIQEWWGLVPHIIDVADRLAAAGFVALAVDHFRGAETVEPDEAQKLMLGLDIAKVADDLAAAADALAARDDVDGERVRTVGFCMGGGWRCWRPPCPTASAARSPSTRRCRGPSTRPTGRGTRGSRPSIHKALSDEPGNGPVIGRYAEAIAAAGGSVEIFDYPDSVHAFYNDARPEVFQPANAALAWERTLAAFRGCTG